MRPLLLLTLLGLVATNGGCVPHEMHRGEHASLPPLEDDTKNHEVASELRWLAERDRQAASRLLAEARHAFALGDMENAYASAIRLQDEFEGSREAREGLYVFAMSSAELDELDHAERALLSLLCAEVAPRPLLGGSMSGAALLTATTCTPMTAEVPDLSAAWLRLGEVEERMNQLDVALTAFGRAARAAAPGSEIRITAGSSRLRLAARAGMRALAFGEAVALVDGGGMSEPQTALAIVAAAQLLIDDDWDGDGLKDTRSSVGRPEVARWLRGEPAGGTVVLLQALMMLLEEGRCEEARRVRVRLLARADGVDAERRAREAAHRPQCP